LAIITYLSVYWNTSLRRAHWKAFFAVVQIPLLLIIIYRGYSKAAVAIILAWGSILLLMSRQRLFMSLLSGVALVLVATTENRVTDEIESLFRKEIWYAEGQLHENLQYTLLGGRFVYWGSALDNFVDQELAVQLVGVDYVRAASLHNDFLRTLMATGAIGLILYVFLLLQMVWHVVLRTVNRSSKLALPALLALTAFIIDCLGLVPLLYPGYSWVTFGIISMALHPTQMETTPKGSAV
jgi:O-antigen ligase